MTRKDRTLKELKEYIRKGGDFMKVTIKERYLLEDYDFKKSRKTSRKSKKSRKTSRKSKKSRKIKGGVVKCNHFIKCEFPEKHCDKDLPIELLKPNMDIYIKDYNNMIIKIRLDNIDKTVMVSGQMNASQKEFEKYYKQKIDEHIALGHHFIVGGAEGIDIQTINYLLNQKYKDGKDIKITVCITKSEDKKGEFKEILCKNEKDIEKCYLDKMKKINLLTHFDSIKHKTEKDDKNEPKKIIDKYKIRDIFMTKNSFTDIAKSVVYGGASSATGTNLLRRKYGISVSDDIQSILRNNQMDYNKDIAKLTFE